MDYTDCNDFLWPIEIFGFKENELRSQAKFDHTAVYTTQKSSNQADISFMVFLPAVPDISKIAPGSDGDGIMTNLKFLHTVM
jgi:hypothetical protein